MSFKHNSVGSCNDDIMQEPGLNLKFLHTETL